jgi:uncharacterized membrane protein YgcG
VPASAVRVAFPCSQSRFPCSQSGNIHSQRSGTARAPLVKLNLARLLKAALVLCALHPFNSLLSDSVRSLSPDGSSLGTALTAQQLLRSHTRRLHKMAVGHAPGGAQPFSPNTSPSIAINRKPSNRSGSSSSSGSHSSGSFSRSGSQVSANSFGSGSRVSAEAFP